MAEIALILNDLSNKKKLSQLLKHIFWNTSPNVKHKHNLIHTVLQKAQLKPWLKIKQIPHVISSSLPPKFTFSLSLPKSNLWLPVALWSNDLIRSLFCLHIYTHVCAAGDAIHINFILYSQSVSVSIKSNMQNYVQSLKKTCVLMHVFFPAL